MKIRLFCIFLYSILCSNFSFSQDLPLTVKVIDKENSKGVSNALVYIDELHYSDQETDDSGIAYFQNLNEGKISINVRKVGYKNQKKQLNITKVIKDNTIEFLLEKVEKDSANFNALQGSVNITNSPNSIGTIGQIGDNYIVNKKNEEELIWFDGDTEVIQLDSNTVQTILVFGNNKGYSVNNAEIKLHFDNEILEVKNGIYTPIRNRAYSFSNPAKLSANKKSIYHFYDRIPAEKYIFLDMKSRKPLKLIGGELKPRKTEQNKG